MCPTKDHGVRYSGSKDHGVRFRGSFCMRLSQDMGTGTVVCVFKIMVPVPVVFLNTDSSGTGTIEQNHGVRKDRGVRYSGYFCTRKW